MKAVRWYGKEDVRVEKVPDPQIQDPRDAIVQITASGICGSDLHLYDDFMPTMEKGDILGHEPMGIVVETGSAVRNLKKGDRVVVPLPFPVASASSARNACFHFAMSPIQMLNRQRKSWDTPPQAFTATRI